MISLIFIMLAAKYNAVMDTCNHHYHRSIFDNKGFKRYFWDGTISWKNKYIMGNPALGRKFIPVQFTDAFHFFKMLMIVAICASIITFDAENLLLISDNKYFNFTIALIIYGTVWNTTFSLFYNYILIKRKFW